MPYQPLTQEQFKSLKQQGFSADKIISFETRRKSESAPEIVSGIGGTIPREEFEAGRRNWIGNIERPGAAVRSAILGKSLKAGFVNPAEAPPFAETFANQEVDTATIKALKDMGTLLGSKSLRDVKNFLDIYGADIKGRVAGTATDIVTDPVQLALTATTGIAGKVLAPTRAGQAVSRFARLPIEETLPGRTITKAVDFVKKAPLTEKLIAPLPKSAKRAIRGYHYATQPEPNIIGAETVYRPKVALEIKPKLVAQAKTKYGEQIKGVEEKIGLEKEILGTKVGEIEAKAGEAGAFIKSQAEAEKVALKKSLDDLALKTKKNTDRLTEELKLNKEKASIEGKRRIGKLGKENSDTYDSKLDVISDEIEKMELAPTGEGKIGVPFTKGRVAKILDDATSEIEKEFLGEGAPLKQIELLKEKYGIGLSSETNPEAILLQKKFGKLGLKDKGIDFSKAEISGQMGFNPNEKVNFKEFLKDLRKVYKQVSSGAKGVLRESDPEDLPAYILKKHFGKWASENAPEFGKLQSEYSHLIEQMKMGRKIFKPGAEYILDTKWLNDVLIGKADIKEKELANALFGGTEGYNKGLGDILQPARKSLGKIEGVKKSGEIVGKSLKEKSLLVQDNFNRRITDIDYALRVAKSGTQEQSVLAQKELLSQAKGLEKVLANRIAQLEARKGIASGKLTNLDELLKRAKMLERQKKIASAGGAATVVDMIMRRLIYRGVIPGR